MLELQNPALLFTSGTGVWLEGYGLEDEQEVFFPASLEVAFGRVTRRAAPVH